MAFSRSSAKPQLSLNFLEIGVTQIMMEGKFPGSPDKGERPGKYDGKGDFPVQGESLCRRSMRGVEKKCHSKGQDPDDGTTFPSISRRASMRSC